jgi:hypothetical protein
MHNASILSKKYNIYLHIFWTVLQQVLNAFYFLSEIYVFQYVAWYVIILKTAAAC